MTTTAPAPADELPMEPLPEDLQPAPPAAPVVEQTYAMLPVDAITTNPDNPRSDMGDIDGLAASIRSLGVQEPLLVEWPSPTSPYLLLAGHRRLAAAKLAGLTEVPCLVRQTASTAALRMEIALVENLQREGLPPLDEANGYAQLTKLGLSQRKIADRVGCSQSHVSKRLNLLELPKPVQTQVGKGALTLEAAALLMKLKDHPDRLEQAAKERPDRIADAVRVAEEEIAFETKVLELRSVAEARGWPVVGEPPNEWDKRSFKTLAKWGYKDAELDIPVQKHEAEPCHAVMIPVRRTYRPPSATSVCTEPARHGPKGASELKEPAEEPQKAKMTKEDRERPKEQAKREADAKARTAAAEARKGFLVHALAEYRPGKLTPALRVVLSQLVLMDYDQVDAFLLLGLPHDEDLDTYDALVAYSREGDDELQRAALAIALANAEARMRYVSQLGPDDVGHYAYLATLGYEPSPWEKAKLAEAAEWAKAVDGG
jgi:ParB/RepB/Spo0J family partition protein